MYNEFDLENSPSNAYIPLLIKSIGDMDADGNYIFEVEASNENLDLQNQRIQQNALLKSKEFFLTNGVISDDHQHKRYDKDGNVISDKSKIIGEPISVRTDGTSTFVKGKLYGDVPAAQDFIRLLKAHSSRVKASVGGIMPTVIKNRDGTETVTSFRWNDLALTCSPVNYTVGSAVFAKAMSNLDFCKALTAGYGTDSATMTGGRALQNEDLEKTTANVIPENQAIEETEDENDIDAINELMAAIGTGEIKRKEKMEAFLVERGYSKEKARASVREIISQGGHTIMAKGSLFGQVSEILKSFGGGSSPDNAGDEKDKDTKKPDESGAANAADNGGSAADNGGAGSPEPAEKDNDGGDDDKDGIEKSLGDGYTDASEVIGSIYAELKKSSDAVEELKKRLDGIDAMQEEVSKSVVSVAESLAKVAGSPLPTKSETSIAKSDLGGNGAAANAGNGKFTMDDWNIAKSVLTKAVKAKEITLEKSEALSSACQKTLHGGAMSREVWNEMSALCKKYASN